MPQGVGVQLPPSALKQEPSNDGSFHCRLMARAWFIGSTCSLLDLQPLFNETDHRRQGKGHRQVEKRDDVERFEYPECT